MDADQNKREALLTTVMNLFSDAFRDNAILHGGMVLRLLECPRYTNDIDYLFVPFKSKNDVKEMILSVLSKIPNIKLAHTINSKCIRIRLKTPDDVIAQVEVKVGPVCKTDTLTSEPLSRLHHQPARVVAVMNFGVALANKLSAWLERRLFRDLYDIHFMLNMGIQPDSAILKERLRKPVYGKGVIPCPGKTPLEINSFYDFLKDETRKINDTIIAEELADILAEPDRIGLAMRIKASITSRL